MKYCTPYLRSNDITKTYCQTGSAASITQAGGYVTVSTLGVTTTNVCYTMGQGDSYGPSVEVCGTGTGNDASGCGAGNVNTTEVKASCDTGNGPL